MISPESRALSRSKETAVGARPDGRYPGVDGLIVVTDHTDVVMWTHQGLDQLELCRVRVLVFVNLQAIEALLVPLKDLGKIMKKLIRQQQQIIKIDGIAAQEQLLIAGEYPFDNLIAVAVDREIIG